MILRGLSKGVTIIALVVVVPVVGVSASSAMATTAAPALLITSIARPTNFTPGDVSGNDAYHVLVTNAGGKSTEGPVTISDIVPSSVAVQGIEFHWSELPEVDFSFLCTPSPLRCTFPIPLSPGGILQMIVHVTVDPNAVGSVTNEARVEGGEAPTASTSNQNEISSTSSPFGISDLSMSSIGTDGALDTQAGDHPYAIATSLEFNTVPFSLNSAEQRTPENPKDVVVDLPMGLVGNPTTAPQCPLVALTGVPHSVGCPANSQIGEVTFYRADLQGGIESSVMLTQPDFLGGVSPLYNLVPEHGYPAEFGFTYAGHALHLYAGVVRTEVGYVLRVSAPDTPGLNGALQGVTLTVFGDPTERDAELRQQALERETEHAVEREATTPAPFFTNPTDCSASEFTVTAHVDSWTHPGRVNADGTPDFSDPNWNTATSTLPPVSGCDQLQFNPAISVRPDTMQADSPAGLDVDLKVPQAPNAPGVLATPELQKAVVALPQGVAVSPSGANGLAGCSPVQISLDSNSEPTCPDASKIGTAELDTPLLSQPLGGSIYLAQQNNNPFGSLMALYLVVDDATTGVLVKLPGEVSVDPVTGQLTTTFDNNPQIPFSELKLHLKGGPRASLVTPQACGTYTTTTRLTPWSAPDSGPPATPSSSFPVTSGCSAGFAPSFTAGTTSNQAGGFSPFSVTFSRQDGEQRLAVATVQTPPGLLGVLKSVTQCPEPQASNGTCGPESLIGHTTVGAGPGPSPFYIGGNVFLTGRYEGAPFGLSIVTHALAGPFDLGNVIVRAQVNVDPHSAQITVTSDPLPTILQGIPLDLRTVKVTVDKANFMFNPTNCSPLTVGATITSTNGASAGVSSPFQAANCATLPFKPKFTVLTQAKTSKANGAYLHVKVASGPGQANIAKVKVDLPKQLPSRLTTLQKACPDATFNANPASCPAASLVGTATAVTPVLKNPLTGPAYLVSHAAAAFPGLEIVLQGEGITLVLDGNTNIKKGITSSTFNSVPDAPISTFDLVLPGGPHSALAANANLCKSKLNMPTALTGQNGAVIKQTTKIAVSGCPKHKAKKRKKSARKHKKASHKHK
jgi:hypothetical protein